MRAFIAAALAAVLIAVGSAIVLNLTGVGSAQLYATDNVRLGGDE